MMEKKVSDTGSMDDLYAAMQPESVALAKAKAKDISLEIAMADLRKVVHMTQGDVAEQMGVTQPTVSSLEKSVKNAKLDTFSRYVEACGGEMTIQVKMPNGEQFNVAM